MLTLWVQLKDADEKCSQLEKSVLFGQSRIEAFASNQITMSFRETKDLKEIWIGEEAAPYENLPWHSSVDKYRTFVGFEGINIVLHWSKGKRVLEAVRTAAGSSPLYIAIDKDIIVASWKFEDAVKLVRSPKPNVDACRIFAEYNACQVRHQVIDGIFMLWPGESFSFCNEGIRFHEAEVPDIVLPSTLSEGAQVTIEFQRLIAESLRKSLEKSAQPIIELSGGLDSTCVAIAACSNGKRINSYGLIHEGAMGVQQQKRRKELVKLLGVNDFEYPSYNHTPIASLEVEECKVTPFDDNHRLPCVYAVDNHPVKDVDLIITGIGGDELTMENTFFRQEWELSGNICTSAIVAATARADMFMTRGIWPKNPLLDQSVVDFCRALPKKMRDNRLLNVLTIARVGLSDGFLFPRYHEHYGNAMQREAALFDYDAALSDSIVADYGVVDTSALLTRARAASYGGFSYNLLGELYNLLKLETILRRYIA